METRISNFLIFIQWQIVWNLIILCNYIDSGADPGFFAGGGVNNGRVLQAPLAPAPTGGLGLINIRLRYIASIEYSERFFLIFFFLLVKKFVEKKNWWSRAGGVTTPPPSPRIRACRFVFWAETGKSFCVLSTHTSPVQSECLCLSHPLIKDVMGNRSGR